MQKEGIFLGYNHRCTYLVEMLKNFIYIHVFLVGGGFIEFIAV